MLKNPTTPFQKNAPHFKKIWPAYEHRPEQEQMAEAVREALTKPQYLLIEAGTGVGKTLAYLLPLVHFALQKKIKVAVSTETRALQQQIIKKDIPMVEKLLGAKIRAELCLGANNYVCKRSLYRMLNDGSFDTDMQERLPPFVEWEGQTPTGIAHEYDGIITPHFRREAFRNSETCLGEGCRHYNESFYFLARRRWAEAHILIVNHSLLVSQLAYGVKILPDIQHIVLDEAHSFPEIFSKAHRSEAAFNDIEKTLTDVAAQTAAKLPPEFRQLLSDSFRVEPGRTLRLREPANIPGLEPFFTWMKQAETDIKKEINTIKKERQQDLWATDEDEKEEYGKRTLELQTRLDKLTDHRQLLQSINAGPGDGVVHWIARPEGDVSYNCTLCIAPVDSGPAIKTGLLQNFRTIVCTSATLTTAGSEPFRYYRHELGLRSDTDIETGTRPTDDDKNPEELRAAIATHKLASPFDYERQAILYLPANMPDPSREEERFHESVAQLIGHLLRLTRGGAFLLFTSNRSLRAVRELLLEESDLDDINFISQPELGAPQALSAFQEHEHAALLGLASFWQGVDVPGDRLRLVVLVRLPFRVPDEPVFQARMECEEREGRRPFSTLQLPAAVLSMRQGFGRLIRSTADRGVVCIADPRIQSKSYGKQILSALPLARRVYRFSEFRRYYHELFPALSIRL